ncbi:MAG: hypothetical protein WC335_02605 [Candidatus Omnitrophota bacterium]|jgi:hypothetical protein
MSEERVTRRQKDVSRLVREKRRLQKYTLAATKKDFRLAKNTIK